MIRALRIALANWIMSKPKFVARSGMRYIREAKPNSMLTVIDGKMVEVPLPPTWLQDDAKVVAAVKTFPGGLTVWPKP